MTLLSPRDKNQENYCVPPKDIRQIPLYPDYWITDDGQVISFKRKIPRILKPRKNRDNRAYFVVDNRCVTAARLIALAFYPSEYFPGAEADHIDNTKFDHQSNVQWLSKTDNCRKHFGYPLGVSWIVESPNGDRHRVESPAIFAKSHGLNPRSFGEMLNQKMVQSGQKQYLRKSVSGWRVIESHYSSN